MKTITLGGLALAFWVLSASPAHAQDTFDDLVRKIHQGQIVIVTDQQGGRTRGRVESGSPPALVVNFGMRQTFAPPDVRRITKPDPAWDGAIKGAAVGLIPALLVGALDCDGGLPGAMAALALGAGAGIGVAIDALWGPKTVFRSSTQPARVSVAPIVSRD